jgi:hypothetical protein
MARVRFDVAQMPATAATLDHLYGASPVRKI